MKIEVHLLQNFAPSCLNRDDTGSPKQSEFGGVTRARVSSQCFKRAVRKTEPLSGLLRENGGRRTRALITEIATRICEPKEADKDTIKLVAEVFKEGGLDRPANPATDAERDTTSVIVFLDEAGIGRMVDEFKTALPQLRSQDKDGRAPLIKRLGEILAASVTAPDIALFGRMLELKESTPFGKLNLRVDAACQVAHALSTHAVSYETDFFTAVDDLAPVGAAMMGHAGFNSACYYRYALIDWDQLLKHLRGQESATAALKAFIGAFTRSIPTGKQNSMAAHNPPDFGLFVVRDGGVPVSMANAFANPVGFDDDGDIDLIGRSVERLARYWANVARVYGTDGIVAAGLFHIDYETRLEKLKPLELDSLVDVVERSLRGAKKQTTSEDDIALAKFTGAVSNRKSTNVEPETAGVP